MVIGGFGLARGHIKITYHCLLMVEGRLCANLITFLEEIWYVSKNHINILSTLMLILS